MAKDETSERVILQLRAVLRGISPLIWRRLLVRSDSSIAQLHEVLQIAFGWEDMHLHRFEIRGREYGLSRDGGAFVDFNNSRQLFQQFVSTAARRAATAIGQPGGISIHHCRRYADGHRSCRFASHSRPAGAEQRIRDLA